MTTTSFLGIPIDGDIVRAERNVRQRPLEDLAPLMQAVLDDDGIACFGWRQYTPYFNDGEPCVFSAHGVWAARPEDLDENGERDRDAELDVDYGGHHGSYEGGEWVNNPETGDGLPYVRVGARYVGPDKARYDRLLAVNDAIDSGAFDDVLLDAFGDHAEITVKRDGITVEFYEHD